MSATTQQLKSFIRRARWGLLALVLSGLSGHLYAEDVQLTWSDNSDNEEGFTIERSVGDGSFEVLTQVAADVETYTDSTAEAGVEYKYRVNAFNAFGVSGYTNVAPHYINVAPTISDLDPVVVEENESASGLAFTVGDFEAAAGDLTVTVTSSNLELIDSDGISLGGSNAQRTLSLTPNVNASGNATITVTVSDGEDSSSADFLFSVNTFVFPSLQLAIDTIGAGPRAGEDFSLSSTASDDSLVSSVSYYLNNSLLGEVAEAPYNFSFGISEEGAYDLSAVAKIAGRQETVTSESSIVVGPAPSSNEVVSNLRTLAVDAEASPGTASYDLAADELYLENENGLIAGSSDSHHYYYLRAEGDVSISANLSEIVAASSQSVAGLMVRSALYGKSAQTSLLRDANGAFEIRTRDSRGGTTQFSSGFETSTGDNWLRIDKVGSSIKYYSRSAATSDWKLIEELTVDLGNSVFLGFAIASGSQGGLASASFSQARFEGDILPLGDDAIQPALPSGLIISSLVE